MPSLAADREGRGGARRSAPAIMARSTRRRAGEHDPALIDYLLRLGDDALILGQRLGEWCGHAPALEVDLSLANLALDLIGQATHFLGAAGRRRPAGLPPRRARFQQLPAGRAAQRRFRPDHRPAAAVLDLAAHALPAAGAVERRAVPARVRGQGGQGSRLSPRAGGRMDDPARRRHRGERAAHGRRARLVLALHPRAVRGRRGAGRS